MAVKYITTRKAIEMAGEYNIKMTTKTVAEWCDKYGIGKKIAGRYRIYANRWRLFLEGKTWDQREKEDRGDQAHLI